MRDHTVTTALARIVGEQRAPEAAAVALPHPSVRTPHGVLRIAPLLGPAALAVEGRLPACAASLGEVDVVTREKDRYLHRVLEDAAEQARTRSVELKTDLVPRARPPR